jgi:hypothetical protein
MITTLDLPDHLLAEIKISAAKQQRKVNDLITESLEQGLQFAPKKARKSKEIEVNSTFKEPFPKALQDVKFNHLADTIELEEKLDKLSQC